MDVWTTGKVDNVKVQKISEPSADFKSLILGRMNIFQWYFWKKIWKYRGKAPEKELEVKEDEWN